MSKDGKPSLAEMAEAFKRISKALNQNCIAADRVLNAACVETVRQIRAGETTYVIELVAATRAANLLIGAPR